jgi:cyclic pyranopterin phosphate synthase
VRTRSQETPRPEESPAPPDVESSSLPFHASPTPDGSLPDGLMRPLHDLRLSVTDRCNLRCSYCMPAEVYGAGYPFLPRSELLTFEELRDVATVFVGLGVKKLRITGGEPLLRAQLPTLVQLLSPLGAELALTTNGILLGKYAGALKDAGLHRVTVSLDALSSDTFQRMSGSASHTPNDVLTGIDAALDVGLPVKVNTVVRRGVNDQDVVPLVQHFRHTGVTVRFIEYMDVGSTNGWSTQDVVPSHELVTQVSRVLPLRELPPNYAGETSRRYLLEDGSGEIGFISSVTQPFCGDCSRARLSAKGTLYTCLFATSGVDVRGALRQSGPAAVRELIAQTWRQRRDRYSELRGRVSSRGSRIEMSYIGG